MRVQTTTIGLMLWVAAAAIWVGTLRALYSCTGLDSPSLNVEKTPAYFVACPIFLCILAALTAMMRYPARRLKNAWALSAVLVGLFAYLVLSVGPLLPTDKWSPLP